MDEWHRQSPSLIGSARRRRADGRSGWGWRAPKARTRMHQHQHQHQQQQSSAQPALHSVSAMSAAAPSGGGTTPSPGAVGPAGAAPTAAASASPSSACAVVCPLTALLRHYLGMLTCSRTTVATPVTTTAAPSVPPSVIETSGGRAAAASVGSSVGSDSAPTAASPTASLRRRPSRDEHAASHSAAASVGPAPAPTAAAHSSASSASSVPASVQQQWASVQAEHSRSSGQGGGSGSAGAVPLSPWMSAVTEADVAWLRAQPCLLQQSHRLREQAAAAAAAAAAQDRLFQVALPIPVAKPAPAAVVAEALRGTDLYTSTRAQCGLLDDSLRPASVVQMLRGREMHNPAMMRGRGGRHMHGPHSSGSGHGSDCRPACRCGCRSGMGVSLPTAALQVQLQCACPSVPSSSAATPSASVTTSTSTTTRGAPHAAVPSRCAQVHHYESRVFGAQFDHAGRTLCVATQDRHIRLYALDGGDSDADGERWTRHGVGGGLSPCDSDASNDASSHVGQRLFDSRSFAADSTTIDGASSPSSSSSSLSSSSHRRVLPSSWDNGRGWSCTLDVAGRDVGWAIVSTTFSPNDELLAYSTWSPRVHILSTSRSGSGGPVHESLDFKSSSHRFCLFSLCFSPCGRSILGGASDRGVYLHSVELNRPLVRLAGAHGDDVNAVAFLDGHFSGGAGDAILTAGDDHVVKLWDLRLLGGAPDATASSVAGSSASAAAVDSSFARTPRPVSVFAGHTQGITSLSSRGDGRHFVTNSKDQSCKLFDVRLPSPAATAAAAAAAYIPSGSAAAGTRRLPQGGNGQVEAAARTEAQEAQWDYRWPTHVAKVACQERARQAQLQAQQAAAAKATEGARKGCAASFAVSACLQALSPAFPASFAAAASSSSCPSSVDAALSSISASGSKGADSSARSSSATGANGSSPMDRRSATDTSLVTFTGHRVLETLIRAYFSPLASTGQRFVYSGSQCGSVFVWDVLTGETVQRLRGHYGTVRDAAWHPRENILVSASWDCSLARWELPQA